MSTELEVVTTEIEIKDAAVQQAGFGTPLILAYLDATLAANWVAAFGANARTASFTSPDDLVDILEMPTDHPTYLAAQKVMSQRPAPERFKLGRRLGAITHSVRLTPATPSEGEVFSLLVDGEEASVTAAAAPTVADICDLLVAEIDGLTANVDAVDDTTHVTVNGLTTGEVHRFEELSPNLAILDVTANPATTIQTDLSAIRTYDSDWYGLVLDSNSENEINAAAAWAETQRIIMIVTTMDTGAKLAGTITDVASDLRAAGYHRTAIIFHHKPALQYAGGAWLGRGLPKAPGSFTWANKSLAGVEVTNLNDTEREALKGKNCNYYVSIKGIGFTLDGRAASGRYLDITHGMDWFEVRLQERIVALMANNDKVPYTDKGFELVRAQVDAQILAGIDATLIDGDSPWSTSVPRKATINPNDVASRVLPDVKFDFVLQGAVHKVRFRGTARITLT